MSQAATHVAEPSYSDRCLTIDCDDARAMVQFYKGAFDGSADPDFPQLHCVRVDGLLLLFRELEGWARPTWPGSNIQMHLEVYVDDLQKSEARLLGLGASKPEAQDPAGPGLCVLLDPAGHPFCIFERPNPRS